MVAEAVGFTLDFSLIILTAVGLCYVARRTGQPTIIALHRRTSIESPI
jgi:Kef-type K+ transport system membrane component KefB